MFIFSWCFMAELLSDWRVTSAWVRVSAVQQSEKPLLYHLFHYLKLLSLWILPIYLWWNRSYSFLLFFYANGMTDCVCLSAPSSAMLLLCKLVITTTMNFIWKSKDDDERNARSRVRTPTLMPASAALCSPCGRCSSVSIFTFPPVSHLLLRLCCFGFCVFKFVPRAFIELIFIFSCLR